MQRDLEIDEFFNFVIVRNNFKRFWNGLKRCETRIIGEETVSNIHIVTILNENENNHYSENNKTKHFAAAANCYLNIDLKTFCIYS